MHRATWLPVAGVGLVLLLAGCTASKASTAAAPTSASPSSSTVTAAASPTGTAPVVAGPTTAADGTCPWLSTAQALNDIGERLGQVTVSTSGGAPVGCTFYPATGALAESENLPPANVPVIAVTTTRFATDTAAHNAMVVSSQVDPNAYSDPITGADEAISFAATFYAADGNQDNAFTFRKGTAVVLVQIAQTKSAFTAKQIGTDVAANFS